MSKPKKGVRVRVSYRMNSEQFPLDEKLDDKIRGAMKSIGAALHSSGSGSGERDLVFELGSGKKPKGT